MYWTIWVVVLHFWYSDFPVLCYPLCLGLLLFIFSAIFLFQQETEFCDDKKYFALSHRFKHLCNLKNKSLNTPSCASFSSYIKRCTTFNHLPFSIFSSPLPPRFVWFLYLMLCVRITVLEHHLFVGLFWQICIIVVCQVPCAAVLTLYTCRTRSTGDVRAHQELYTSTGCSEIVTVRYPVSKWCTCTSGVLQVHKGLSSF